MKNIFLISALCVLFLVSSCSKTEDTPTNNNNTTAKFNESLLFNKWWYSETGIAYDLILSSNNTFEITHPIGLGDSGTWQWIDNEHTTLEMTVTPGGSNIINEFWIELNNVESSTITLRLSDDNIEYGSLHSYTDTE